MIETLNFAYGLNISKEDREWLPQTPLEITTRGGTAGGYIESSGGSKWRLIKRLRARPRHSRMVIKPLYLIENSSILGLKFPEAMKVPPLSWIERDKHLCGYTLQLPQTPILWPGVIGFYATHTKRARVQLSVKRVSKVAESYLLLWSVLEERKRVMLLSDSKASLAITIRTTLNIEKRKLYSKQKSIMEITNNDSMGIYIVVAYGLKVPRGGNDRA